MIKIDNLKGPSIVQSMNDVIEKGSLQDFIDFAKRYNIFQTSNSKFYTQICDKIKARLDKEGLSYDTVKPNE